MASQNHIRNPIEWGRDQISLAATTVGSLGRSLRGSQESRFAQLPAVCRIKAADLRDAWSHVRHARARARHLATVP